MVLVREVAVKIILTTIIAHQSQQNEETISILTLTIVLKKKTAQCQTKHT